MSASQQQFLKTLFTNEHACVAYLFGKRWPRGFICPFCGLVQGEIAPAYTVVCRDCRKQTSITAHTVMHGSKKTLVSWMRVAWQFCSREDGISAREIQRLLALSSYHTAWRWLQKVRCAAGIAEENKCNGLVLLQIMPLVVSASVKENTPFVAMALELARPDTTSMRVRFAVLDLNSEPVVEKVRNLLIQEEASVRVDDVKYVWEEFSPDVQMMRKPDAGQVEQGNLLFAEASLWLTRIYRGAIDSGYLQYYLDEFSFRHNTASWPDRLLVLEHLLTGLISTVSREDLMPGKNRVIGRCK